MPGRERDEHRRVDPAREQDPGGQPFLDRFVEPFRERSNRLANLGRRSCFSIWRNPIAHLAQPAELPERVAAGRELAHAGQDGARSRHVAIGEVVAHCARVGLRADSRALGERLDLRGEVQRAGRLEKIKRLLAEAVARQHQALLAPIPQRESERATQLVHDLLVPALVSPREQLRAGFVLGSARREPLGELEAVGDDAVEDERDFGIGVVVRLPQDDAVPALGPVGEDPGAVGAAAVATMRQRLERGHESGGVGCPAVRGYPACDGAHDLPSSLR